MKFQRVRNPWFICEMGRWGCSKLHGVELDKFCPQWVDAILPDLGDVERQYEYGIAKRRLAEFRFDYLGTFTRVASYRDCCV
jgi:hypothetical protein